MGALFELREDLLRTTASKEGDFYIVNGNKKWITNGAGDSMKRL